jgi:hypothetical protein
MAIGFNTGTYRQRSHLRWPAADSWFCPVGVSSARRRIARQAQPLAGIQLTADMARAPYPRGAGLVSPESRGPFRHKSRCSGNDGLDLRAGTSTRRTLSAGGSGVAGCWPGKVLARPAS